VLQMKIKRSFLVLFFSFCIVLNAQEISNQEVEYKGQTITLPISSNQINRVVLPSSITSKIVSEEKNIEVEINGKEAFIKFSPIMETIKIVDGTDTPEIEDQSITYIKNQPTEVFFVTKDQTYSFIFVPSQMDAQTILVNHKKKEKEELYFKEKSSPFINVITKLVKEAFTTEELKGYTRFEKDELLASNDQVDVTLKAIHEGANFDIYMLELKNKIASGVRVEERNFLGIVDRPVYAISIFYDNEVYEIPPFDTAQVAIIVTGDNQ